MGHVCETERTIKSKYKHPFPPELYLFNRNIKVCWTDEWVIREGKVKALKKALTLVLWRASPLSKITVCYKSVLNSNNGKEKHLISPTRKGEIKCYKT